MKLVDFDFDLPPELIAQEPSLLRDHSNLLVPGEEDSHQIVKFFEILNYLKAGDVMVFNDSKVINAKLLLTSGERKIHINLNRPTSENTWLAFARPAKKLQKGDQFLFDNHKIIITDKLEDGEIEVKFVLDNISVFDFLAKYGQVPLPQYIKRNEQKEDDASRYQNVYANQPGSVAAPTAGLHFTTELLDKIKQKGVEIRFVTLQVGAGTFLPVKVDNIHDHKMHPEFCGVDEVTASSINKAKKEGRRIVAIGTTAMRTLESCAKDGILIPQQINTNIFITPGYKFQIVDTLITNFHLPKSTLFMLVCAFGGVQKMKSIYNYAISNKMRFFSYGDAMILGRRRERDD
jgi:S-adenosylmethionine:tRNA ribosyltransferase-isomerase